MLTTVKVQGVRVYQGFSSFSLLRRSVFKIINWLVYFFYAIHMQYYLNTNTEYKIAASMDNKNTMTEDLKTVHN